MIPHVHVHGGSNNYRGGRSQIECGEKIIGDAARKFCNDVGGGRCYQEEIGALCDSNVFDGAFEIGLAAGRIAEELSNHFLAAQCGKRERSDEFARATRHYHLHAETFLLQTAHEFRSLVGRDTAGHPERDSHSYLPQRATFSVCRCPCPRRRKPAR